MSTKLANPTAENEDWKQKYRSAVVELDEGESRWREEETRLHKTLLRLAFSFLGHDHEIDQQLKQLQAELKKNPDSGERGKLINGVVEKIIRSSDEPSSRKTPGSSADGLSGLVTKLRVPSSYATEFDLIASRITGGNTDDLEKNTKILADVLNEVIYRDVDTDERSESDTFVEFLKRFAPSGALGTKLSALQKRSVTIKTDLERLAVIDDAIAILSQELTHENSSETSANEARAIVQELIDWMTLPSQVKQELSAIQAKLEEPDADVDLSAILRDLGYTVSEFLSSLMSELNDVEYYLKNIAIRLKELQLGIEESFQDQQDSLDEQENLNSGIRTQVIDIATKLAEEDDISAIKEIIEEGLHEIRTRMGEHLEHDRDRVDKGEKRLNDLMQRIQQMDAESVRLRAQVQQERDRAQRDALTGIPNRAAYDERIVSEIARRNRHNRPLSLAVLDIDKFKGVNDNFGHKAGDKVLKNVAEICVTDVRTSDFMARYGGEEFVLLLPETALDDARIVAEKLRESIAEKRFTYNGERVPITISIGIAEFGPRESADDVFQRADNALYAAKERGRNRCVTEAEISA